LDLCAPRRRAHHDLFIAATLATTWLSGATTARAEYPEMTPYIGLFAGGHIVLRDWEFPGGVVRNARQPDHTLGFSGGPRLGFQLLPQLALEGSLGWVPVPLDGGGNAHALLYSVDALYHVFSADWSPFIIGGLGAYSRAGGKLRADTDFQGHLGIGVRGLVTPFVAFRAEVRDYFTDGYGAPGANNLELTLGVDFFPWAVQAPDRDGDGVSDADDECPDRHGGDNENGCPPGPPDRDGDGVGDADDECPDVFGTTTARGCPDADGDGIADHRDTCRDVRGVASAAGCPDADGDGIADAVDKCLGVRGVASAGGCPDADGDGIVVADDRCPDMRGVAPAGGCPDFDGDGIADAVDKCPQQAGPAALTGCPDADGDGIAGADDKCPQQAGVRSAAGCPDADGDSVADPDDKCPQEVGVREEQGCMPAAVKKFSGVIKGVNFETGSATIKLGSYKVLDGAAAVLVQFPTLRLRIEGHTDNVGDPARNQALSQDRAAAVRDYLVTRGVDATRFDAVGFGDTRPVAGNDTAPGRAANRRIEFAVLGH
jgi:outer membrane protein OmpA-like peptidoglycan-associated protein